MYQIRRQWLTRVALASALTFAAASHLEAQDTLQVINEPGGGNVVYGTIDNQHTPQSAMAFMLRQVHGHFAGRPQVSKVFQVRNTSSYAAFFTLIAQNDGNRAIAGEVIVSMPAGGQPVAAVLSDSAERFTYSQPVMLRKLNEAWHSFSQGASSPASSIASSPQALHRTTAGDRSVYISIPDGWKIDSIAGGSVTAEGPRGERLGLNLMVQGIRDPRVGDRFANLRNPNARQVVYPFGGDLFAAYTNVVNQVRRNQRLPEGTFHLTSSFPRGNGAVEAHFDVDLHDGFGLRSATARIDEIGRPGTPTWAMGISGSSLPKTLAASEGATLLAVIRSASQDQRVVGAEQGAVMEGIRAAGERSRLQAQQADQRRIASSQAFEAHMDNIDHQSKVFQNYILDRSQIQDNELNGRATVSNGLADALIQTDPSRYQVVAPSQFLKGIDY